MRRQNPYLPNEAVGRRRGYRPKESLIQFPSLWLPGSPLPSSRGMPGYPCCCGGVCADCWSEFPEVCVVDVGEGGWTAEQCAVCPTVAGEYVLGFQSLNCWCPEQACTDAPWISVPFRNYNEGTTSCTGQTCVLNVSLILSCNESDGVVFDVIIFVYQCSAAWYQSEDVIPESKCSDLIGNYTLTKQCEEHSEWLGNAVCAGNLPSTIELQLSAA